MEVNVENIFSTFLFHLCSFVVIQDCKIPCQFLFFVMYTWSSCRARSFTLRSLKTVIKITLHFALIVWHTKITYCYNIISILLQYAVCVYLLFYRFLFVCLFFCTAICGRLNVRRALDKLLIINGLYFLITYVHQIKFHLKLCYVCWNQFCHGSKIL